MPEYHSLSVESIQIPLKVNYVQEQKCLFFVMWLSKSMWYLQLRAIHSLINSKKFWWMLLYLPFVVVHLHEDRGNHSCWWVQAQRMCWICWPTVWRCRTASGRALEMIPNRKKTHAFKRHFYLYQCCHKRICHNTDLCPWPSSVCMLHMPQPSMSEQNFKSTG